MKTQKDVTEYVRIDKGDGRRYVIKKDIAVIKDLSEICPYCGVNCMGSYYLWFVENEKRKTIMVDRYRFDSLLRSCFEMENDRILNYKQLPQFIAEHNECREWASFESVDGEEIDKKTFREALEFVESRCPGDIELIELLKEFLTYCEVNSHIIKISEE